MTVSFETVPGSRAYGLATEASDTGLRGVFVQPSIAYTGYRERPDQLEPSAERMTLVWNRLQLTHPEQARQEAA